MASLLQSGEFESMVLLHVTSYSQFFNFYRFYLIGIINYDNIVCILLVHFSGLVLVSRIYKITMYHATMDGRLEKDGSDGRIRNLAPF